MIMVRQGIIVCCAGGVGCGGGGRMEEYELLAPLDNYTAVLHLHNNHPVTLPYSCLGVYAYTID